MTDVQNGSPPLGYSMYQSRATTGHQTQDLEALDNAMPIQKKVGRTKRDLFICFTHEIHLVKQKNLVKIECENKINIKPGKESIAIIFIATNFIAFFSVNRYISQFEHGLLSR